MTIDMTDLPFRYKQVPVTGNTCAPGLYAIRYNCTCLLLKVRKSKAGLRKMASE